MKYSKSLDHALLATYYANKAAKAKSITAKRIFEKKAFASILEAGKQSDTTYGMKVLEASLRLAAENEGMAPAEDAPVEDLPVEEEMLQLMKTKIWKLKKTKTIAMMQRLMLLSVV